MEEKQICCCGSSGWTRVIGWFQIIGAVMAIILLVILLVGSTVLRASVDSARDPKTNQPLSPEEMRTMKAALTGAIVGGIVLLILATFSFIMAIVLLRGSYNRNPRQIHAWMVYTVICLILSPLEQFFYEGAVINKPCALILNAI
ncbi:unnamed protein product [Allacma fusca]|uniref:Uncharacterized protein n=1 Tax=Allacma fusca TaxID=39272 RepID=A0A8J2KL55_9HEXA|nr:unnamed protein product [Allacma fusca]